MINQVLSALPLSRFALTEVFTPILPIAGFVGVENRSSSVELPNKSELGLALAGGTKGFVVLGFEENNSSSFSLSRRSAELDLPGNVHVRLRVHYNMELCNCALS